MFQQKLNTKYNKAYLLLTLAMLCFFNKAYATELDSYTYRHIPLKDFAKDLNKIVEGKLLQAQQETNQFINKKLKQQRSVSSMQIEREFISNLQSGLASYTDVLISRLEFCIYSNNCKNWPFIERIVHLPEESIYYRANYNPAAQSLNAAIVNLCGHRIGSDKLTHFFSDGIVYYNAWMMGMDSEKIAKKLYDVETFLMGSSFTGVYSHADIAANLRGIDFYKNLFGGKQPYFKMKNKELVYARKFNICRYASAKWDEVLNPSDYTQTNAAKLLATIKDELLCPSQIDRNAILYRSIRFTSLSTLGSAVGVFAKSFFTQQGLITTKNYVYAAFFSNTELKRNTQIKKLNKF